jgi:uncharacterized membrane protein YphA (DoxX/SURF4 family)
MNAATGSMRLDHPGAPDNLLRRDRAMQFEIPTLVFTLMSFLGWLFLYAGIVKAISVKSFSRQLSLLPLIPEGLAWPAALIVAAAEILTGTMLLLGLAAGAIAAIGALTIFSAIAVIAVAREQQIACNCFGAAESEPLSLRTVARNVSLIALATLPLITPPQPQPPFTAIYGLILLLLCGSLKLSAVNHRLLSPPQTDPHP